MASMFSHELAETATDPKLNAWNSTSAAGVYELIGDSCETQFGVVSTTPSGTLYNVKLGSYYFMLQELFDPSFGGGCAQSIYHGPWAPPSPPPPLWTVPAGAPPPAAPPLPPLPPLLSASTGYQTLSTTLSVPAPAAMPGIAVNLYSQQNIFVNSVMLQFALTNASVCHVFWRLGSIDDAGALMSTANWTEATPAAGVPVAGRGLHSVVFSAVHVPVQTMVSLYVTVTATAVGNGIVSDSLNTTQPLPNTASDGTLQVSAARIGGYPMTSGVGWTQDRFLWAGSFVYQFVPAPPPPSPPPPSPPQPPAPKITGAVGQINLVGYSVSSFGIGAQAAFVNALQGFSPNTTVAIIGVQANGPDRVTVNFTIGSINATTASTAVSALASLSSSTLLSRLGLANAVVATLSLNTTLALLPLYAPVSSLTVGQSAGPVAVNPFVCGAPTTQLITNATYVGLMLTYSTAQSALSTPYGRTPFTFASFNSKSAGPLLWDPSSAPNASFPFGMNNPTTTTAFGRYFGWDNYTYAGMCSPSAVSAAPYYSSSNYANGGTVPGYPFAGNCQVAATATFIKCHSAERLGDIGAGRLDAPGGRVRVRRRNNRSVRKHRARAERHMLQF